MEDPELKSQLIWSKNSRDDSVMGMSGGESRKRRGQEGSCVCVCVCGKDRACKTLPRLLCVV